MGGGVGGFRLSSDELFYQTECLRENSPRKMLGRWSYRWPLHSFPWSHPVLHNHTTHLTYPPSWKSQPAVALRSKDLGPWFSEYRIFRCTSYLHHIEFQCVLALTSNCQHLQLCLWAFLGHWRPLWPFLELHKGSEGYQFFGRSPQPMTKV